MVSSGAQFGHRYYLKHFPSILTNITAGSLPFSRKHPLSLWVSSMLVIFAGGILANLLLGEPVLAPLKNNNQLLLSTIVW